MSQASIPFGREEDVRYGEMHEVGPLVRRIVARNPGPFTYHGTGTFVIGRGRVAVIDPGPLLDAHVDALLDALDGETITHQLITHTHRDHSPAAAPVKSRTGAPTYGFGPHAPDLRGGAEPVEEGGDMDFVPDHVVRDGDVIEGDGWTVTCVHTPGHTSNHVCFALAPTGALFSGDHVMGWNTTIVVPPDGHMGDYLASLRKLIARDDAVYHPTHGPAIERPGCYVKACLAHRLEREAQILTGLAAGESDVGTLVAALYRHLPESMHGAAARQVHAQLVHLVERGEVLADGPATLEARYRLP